MCDFVIQRKFRVAKQYSGLIHIKIDNVIEAAGEETCREVDYCAMSVYNIIIERNINETKGFD